MEKSRFVICKIFLCVSLYVLFVFGQSTDSPYGGFKTDSYEVPMGSILTFWFSIPDLETSPDKVNTVFVEKSVRSQRPTTICQIILENYMDKEHCFNDPSKEKFGVRIVFNTTGEVKLLFRGYANLDRPPLPQKTIIVNVTNAKDSDLSCPALVSEGSLDTLHKVLIALASAIAVVVGVLLCILINLKQRLKGKYTLQSGTEGRPYQDASSNMSMHTAATTSRNVNHVPESRRAQPPEESSCLQDIPVHDRESIGHYTEIDPSCYNHASTKSPWSKGQQPASKAAHAENYDKMDVYDRANAAAAKTDKTRYAAKPQADIQGRGIFVVSVKPKDDPYEND